MTVTRSPWAEWTVFHSEGTPELRNISCEQDHVFVQSASRTWVITPSDIINGITGPFYYRYDRGGVDLPHRHNGLYGLSFLDNLRIGLGVLLSIVGLLTLTIGILRRRRFRPLDQHTSKRH